VSVKTVQLVKKRKQTSRNQLTYIHLYKYISVDLANSGK